MLLRYIDYYLRHAADAALLSVTIPCYRTCAMLLMALPMLYADDAI